MKSPIPVAVVALALGATAVAHLSAPVATGLLLALGVLATLARRLGNRRGSTLFTEPGTVLLVLLAVLAGGVRVAIGGVPDPAGLDAVSGAVPRPVRLEGVVLDVPDRSDAPLDLRLIEGPGGLRGPARVRLAPGTVPPLPGDRIRFVGIVRPRGRGPTRPRLIVLPDPAALHIVRPGSAWLPRRLATRLRRVVRAAIHRAATGRGAALVEALLLGRRDGLPAGLERDLRRAGVIHLLVVSGLHVAFAAWAATVLLRSAGCGARTRAVGALAIAGTYAAASGFAAPAARAWAGAAIVLLAPLVRRRADPLHALAVAAGGLLVIDPTAAGDPGFQLSFAAVLGLLRLTTPLAAVLFARRRFLRRFPVPRARRRSIAAVGDLLERGLPPALAAWLATTPVLLVHFGEVSLIAPLANLLLVPVAGFLLAVAAAVPLLGWAFPTVTAAGADAAAAGLAVVAHGLAGLPGAWSLLPPPPPAALALTAAALLLAAAIPRPATLAVGAAAVTGLLLSAALAPPRPAVPAVVVLDVGHGSAVLLDTGVRRVLVDAGGRSPGLGRRRIIPALRERGVVRLDALVISHEDVDHLSAAVAILERLRVGVLIVGPRFGSSDAGTAVLVAAAREGVPVERAARGDRRVWDDLALEVLHPARRPPLLASDNDRSLVLRGRLSGLSILLPGDIERPGLETLLTGGVDLRADVLVLPHHGSPGVGGHEALAATVRPARVVASAGRGTRRVRAVGVPGAPPLEVTGDRGTLVLCPRAATGR